MTAHTKTGVCKQCGESYAKRRPLQVVCSLPCALAQSKEKRQRAIEKAQRKEMKQRREKLKTQGDYIREAQTAVNRYIRARDWDKPCISCGAMPRLALGGAVDAGHFRSTGAATHLRFHLLNIFGQCVRCNRNLSGNATEYRRGLIARIGEDRVKVLEEDYKTRRYSINELCRMKRIFNKRARYYEKRRGL